MKNNTWKTLSRIERLQFPITVFPPWLAVFFETIANMIGTKVDIVATIALAVVSAALVGRIGAQISKTQFVRAQIYTCVVANPSAGKDPIIRLLSEPLSKYIRSKNQRLFNENHARKLMRNWYERQQERALNSADVNNAQSCKETILDLVKKAKENDPIPLLPTPITDISPEQLQERISESDGCGFLLASDSQVLDMCRGQYAKNGLPNNGIFLAGFEGEPLVVDRVSRDPLDISSANISILAGAQKPRAEAFVKDAKVLDSGLVARFLFSCPENEITTPVWGEDPDEGQINAWNELIKKLADINRDKGVKSPLVLKCDEDVQYFFYKIGCKFRGASLTEFADLSGYAGKAKTIHAKLATLLAMMRDPTTKSITIHDAMNASVLYEYFLSHFRALSQGSGLTKPEENVLSSIMKLVTSDNPVFPEMRPYEMIKQQARFHGDDGKQYYRNILLSLTEKGYIRKDMSEQKRAGRSTSWYEVNPDLLNPDSAEQD